MNKLPVLNFRAFIDAAGESLTTDSLKVAAVHGKQHRNVLKLIRARIEDAGDWGVLNFKQTLYTAANGEVYPSFTMTKDGYAFLVGKMTGKKAVEHQIAYIEAFNSMAAYIRNQREGLTYRCMEKELECQGSKERGSIHGRGLNQRKQEKPILETELAALKNLVQPSLLN
jgi:Rha family phage regulatory protein